VATTNKPAENLPAKRLRAIWQEISPTDWLALLLETRPNNKWVLAGSTIKGLCVCTAHQDTTPSFTLNFERGSAACFGASCKYTEWNPIRFAAELLGTGYSTAARLLKSRYNVKLPPAFLQNVQQIEDNQMLKVAICRALNLELLEILANPDNPDFAYADAVGLVPWLRQRQFPEDAVHMWPVGVLPPRHRLADRMREVGSEKMVDAAGVYLEKYLAGPSRSYMHEGSLVFFFYTTPTSIGRFRIRHPNSKDFYAVEDPYVQEVGFFGLNMYNHLLGELERYPLHVVEGEMDALAIISNQCALASDDICIVATGGSMESDLQQLMEFGFPHARTIPDNDPEGIGWAKTLMSKNSCVQRIYRWSDEDRTLKIKDADEAIRARGYAPFITGVMDDSHFPHGYDWVGDQLEQELAVVDPTDVRLRCEIAGQLGLILKDNSERTLFLNLACTQYGLDKSALLQNMIPDDDSAESFVRRLAKKLREEEYHFLSQKQQAQGASVAYAWSKRKRVVRVLHINSKSLLQGALASDLGSLPNYVRTEIGMPEYMQYRRNPKGVLTEVPQGQQESLVVQAFAEAVQCIVSETTHKDWLTELGQGVHWLPDVDNSGQPSLVVANGTKLFHGKVEDFQIKFEEIDNPIVGKYFFRLQTKPWSQNINSVQDLLDGNEINPRDIYDKLLGIFRLGWKFRNHDLESMFLAADVLYSTVFSAFQHLSMVDIAGESHSGKTTLMQVIGGNEFPDLRLCEAVQVIDDFSAAAIRQSMNGVRLRLFLDEFEDDDASGHPNRRSMAVRDVLELIRSMTSGTSRIIRGTTSGESLEYNLHFPATVGGIFTMQEPRDLNRFVHIRTQRIEGIRDPVAPIREHYTPEELLKVRRGVTLCLLPRLPRLLQAYEEAKQEFARNATLPANIMTRLKDHFLPIVAIMKLVGVDYGKFLADFSKLKMEEMQEQGGMVQESANIWDHVLYTQFDLAKFAPDSDLAGYTSLSKILSNHATRAQLNASDAGVYFVEKKMWLVVFWQKAMTGVLRHSPKYRNAQSPGRLKTIADSDSRAVSKELLKNNVAFLKDIRQRTGTNVALTQLSVIDLTTTLATQDGTGCEEEVVLDTSIRARMLTDIPDASVLDNHNIKQRGNFEV